MKKTIPLVLLILFFSPKIFSQSKNDSLYNALVKNDTASLKYFIQQGADVNFIKKQGWVTTTPLITAINNNNLDIVKILILNKANVNWEDNFNSTALMYAANIGNIQIVQLLIDHRADIKHKDKQGNTALSTAKAARHNNIIKLLEEKMK